MKSPSRLWLNNPAPEEKDISPVPPNQSTRGEHTIPNVKAGMREHPGFFRPPPNPTPKIPNPPSPPKTPITPILPIIPNFPITPNLPNLPILPQFSPHPLFPNYFLSPRV